MSSLLDSGYKIIAMTATIFTLEKDSKYLYCEIRNVGGGQAGNRDANSD